jgi:two-component system, OmpR family, copper resistance phosphate regulon response regulator CusR
MALRLLVIEDDLRIAATLRTLFESHDFEVSIAHTGEDGFFRLTTELFDLLILDVGLPGRSGFDVLQALRQTNKELPVLVLSARDDVNDRVHGLRVGADDYLPKPFDTSELLARTEALIRRGRHSVALRLKVGDLFMDLVNHKVIRNGRQLDLTVREFELTEYFMRHAHGIVSRDMLARDVWKEVNRATPLDNVIDVNIARLRKKIDADDAPRLIHTVRGIGFCLSDSEPMEASAR